LSGVQLILASRLEGRNARYAVQGLYVARGTLIAIGEPDIFRPQRLLRREPFWLGGRPMDIGRSNPRRAAMSRKFILSLVAIATLASTAFVSGSADAMVNNQRGGRINVHFIRPIRERIYVRPVALATPIVEGPCTCLWKGYTPEGNVVFKDLCTKEVAMAPAEGGPAQASEIQAPGNFAGKTYQDYLAANPQQQVPAEEPKKN
jgi:hypothetical protein